MNISEKVPVHGGDWYTASQATGAAPESLIDFSANIMPFGLSGTVRQAIINGLEACCHYPDPEQRELRRQLADRHGLDPAQIACGNGAADLLYRAVQALKPRRVYLPVPSFLEYAKACREQQAQIITYNLPIAQDFAVTEDLVDWLEAQIQNQNQNQNLNQVRVQVQAADLPAGGTGGQDLLILCNPNNPTGLLIRPDLLRRIAACCRRHRICLLVDECFLDFVGQEESASLIGELSGCDPAAPLLILRSMTKFFAMPGLRLGYICTGAETAAAIRATGQPWPVSAPAEIAGLAALQEWRQENAATRRTRRDWLLTERARLRAALVAQGWQVWPGSANFLFFHAPGCPDLAGRLLRQRLLIRSCANYPGLGPDYYRIAVRTASENQSLIAALQEDESR